MGPSFGGVLLVVLSGWWVRLVVVVGWLFEGGSGGLGRLLGAFPEGAAGGAFAGLGGEELEGAGP